LAKPKKPAAQSAWGDPITQYFFDLGPERVLDAVEAAGYRCTGLVYALNSYENRVYDVEVENDAEGAGEGRVPLNLRRIVKFYRPGRWSKEQILEEHEFMRELGEAEVPAVAPLSFPDGTTLRETPGAKLWYTLFPKVGGRVPDELSAEQLEWIGRLLARLHNVGASHPARHRIELTPATYGLANLEYLLEGNWLPPEVRANYEQYAREICRLAEPLFREIRPIRIHGDCHMGNLLWDKPGPFLVDFDDMVRGPEVQDFWLLLPGRGEDVRESLDALLRGYETLRPFARTQLKLIEILRALRFVHFSAWIARRWKDPAFPGAFPDFNTPRYWDEKTRDLREQLSLILQEMQGF